MVKLGDCLAEEGEGESSEGSLKCEGAQSGQAEAQSSPGASSKGWVVAEGGLR